jgi:hypothetical protein
MTQPDWQHIREARFTGLGTVADLKMPSGRVYRATWEYRGRCCAWWPAPGQIRRNPIGLYEPEAFSIIASGICVPPAGARPTNRPSIT